jgi:hypothetical protein
VKIVAFPFALLVATVAHAQNLTFDCEFGSGTSCGAPAASTNTSTDAQVSMGSKLNTNSSFNQTYGYFETEATFLLRREPQALFPYCRRVRRVNRSTS